MHIFLIGYMGCGKSYWGKRISHALDFDFIDLDDLIEEREGMNIPDIFSQHGEDFFREREQLALESIKGLEEPCVISTGGGAPCFHDNMSLMNAIGQTLFLDASPLILKQNILKSESERPIVKTIAEEELEAYISNHLKERLPFYEQAKLKLNVNGLRLEDIIQLF